MLKGSQAMKVSKKYDELTKNKSPNSPLWKDLLIAFLVGGALCTIGQALLNIYIGLGCDKIHASAFASSTLIILSMLFTGLGLYDKLAKYAGAGTLVPITGFANAIAAPAIEFRSEGLILGLGTKMFVIAGPVIVYGIVASILSGIIYYFIR